jgi:FAD/FMN-containing dehydrogenase
VKVSIDGTGDNVSVAMNNATSSLLLYDVSLPQHRYYELVEQLRWRVTSQLPDALVVGFGHLGDGNLHLNVQTSTGGEQAATQALALVEPYIFEWSAEAGGSVSAEHGLGTKRQQYLGLAKPPEVIAAMRCIKTQFDPKGIMNPYKVFPD